MSTEHQQYSLADYALRPASPGLVEFRLNPNSASNKVVSTEMPPPRKVVDLGPA